MEAAACLSHFTQSRFGAMGHADRETGFSYGVAKRAVRVWGYDTRPQQGETRSACGLSVRVLKTEEDRRAIAGLRSLAALGAEMDMGLGLAAFEGARDDCAHVMAISRDDEVIATIRMVPVGHGLTGAEKVCHGLACDDDILGDHSWEIGRIIMPPEDRDPKLLQRCLALALSKLLQIEEARHFHATATLQMARLWRRFGMTTAFPIHGASGKQYALVHGDVSNVARILKVPYSAPAVEAFTSPAPWNKGPAMPAYC